MMGSLDIAEANTDGYTLFWYENEGLGNFTDTRSSTTTPRNNSSTIPSTLSAEMADIAVRNKCETTEPTMEKKLSGV